MDSTDYHAGHRSRLRERFLEKGSASLADYELLELLLAYAIPRKDTKPLAKELIKLFGNFASIFDQPKEKLSKVKGLGPTGTTLLLAVRAVLTLYLEEKTREGKPISSPEDVVAFVRLVIGAHPRECLMILCLNAANLLIHHEVISEGTVDQAPAYPREILKTALLHNATALILAHNHPSGRPIPSEQDRYLTDKIRTLASEFNITVHDHLVVCPQQAYSLKTDKLI